MKHFLKLFLLLIALLLPTTAIGVEGEEITCDFEVDGIYYEILGGNQVAVTYQGIFIDAAELGPTPIPSYTGNVSIPETVSYEDITYSVTSIGYDAFCGCSGLTSVTIPNSIINIGEYAFYRCSGLTSVSIPDSVTSIGGGAFRDCSGLTSVTIPNSVTSVGSDAFYGTAWYDNQPDGLVYAGKVAYKYKGTMPAGTSIILADGTLGIAGSAFRGCSSLTSVTIPNSVSFIGDYAFERCRCLTSVTIPNSVTSISGGAFYFCTGLTSVTIPNSVTSIGTDAFYACSGLTSVTIGNSVTTIGDAAFYGCSVLTSVTIPNSVTNIGTGAFRNCSGLTSVTIPNSVTTIGQNAFYGTAWYNNQPDGLVYAGLVAYKYKGIMPAGTSIILADGTLGIAGDAFAGCSSLTSVTIPNSVINIGEYAFYRCIGLTSVTIPSSVMTIDYQAFYACNDLNDVFSFIVDPTTVYLGSAAFALDLGLEIDDERFLHVPFGTSDAYQNTEWSWYFGSIVEMGPMVATSIELDKSSARMEAGEKLQLKAELKPIEAIYNEVLWGSSNPAVATVTHDGLVTAVNAGTATITAMTTDGSNLSASCIVTVYTEMSGDVDGNGLVNISDVTTLIDYLLSGDASAIVLSNADCDGDEAVNISDVTTLIDYLLSGNWPEEPEPTPVIASYTVNGVTFSMVEVEGGTFQMGATAEQEDGARENEKPVHEVTLSSYSIGQTEVTQELWQAVMGGNPSKFNDNVNKPVESISWEDCQTFIARLNELTGQNFRLPTEAEWEFAARGGIKSQGYKYAGSDDLNEIAWYNYNAYAVGSSSPDYGPHAVSTKAANELGLYDMTGNVWEWCQDRSGEYSAADQINPTGPETGTNRVIRGGGWTNYPSLLRVAARTGYTPGFKGNFIGFRLAL